MNKNKIFSRWFFIISAIFVVFNFIIWNMYTKYIFDSEYTIGDLGRMSYSSESLFPREDKFTLMNKHIDIADYNGEDIDVITIGDSFSNAHAGGENAYYQDYISTMYNLKVLNIPSIPDYNYIETITLLNNIGFLKQKKVKYVFIESIQREALSRFSKEIDFNLYIEKFDFSDVFKKITNYRRGKIKHVDMVNNLNFNAFLYNILYQFDDKAMISKCYKADLNKDLFSSKRANKLLFYIDDLAGIKSENEVNINKMNENFNTLANKLVLNNVELYFIPVVDKYNLYSHYIVKNKYPESIFFEQLRKLPRNYNLIDTKEILSNELKKETKDIFYSDDTHWSYKASEIIVKNIQFKD